jgi:hypothetical protein
MHLFNVPLVVMSEDEASYDVEVWKPRHADLARVWEHHEKHHDFIIVDTRDQFIALMMDHNTVILKVSEMYSGTELGLFYFTDIRTGYAATLHYTFWDFKLNGRHRLVLYIMRFMMQYLMLHRLNMRIPKFSRKMLYNILRMGIPWEGCQHEAILHKNCWCDLMIFGVVITDLTAEVIERRSILKYKGRQFKLREEVLSGNRS